VRSVFRRKKKNKVKETESESERSGGGGSVTEEEPMAVMEVAASEFPSPAMHGYLHRKTFSDQWIR
jgi:hypothetical protein